MKCPKCGGQSDVRSGGGPGVLYTTFCTSCGKILEEEFEHRNSMKIAREERL